jgi:hypothetical protein
VSEPFPLSKPFAMAPTRLLARPLFRSALLIMPFLVLASYGLFDERLLGYHHYRQSHDALLARTFATTTADILQPAIDGVTWGKALYINDFPLYPWLVGMAWRVTGESLLVARLIALGFGLAALWAFRRLMLRLLGPGLLVDVCVLVLGMMPVCAWFFRTVQRQSLFVFLALMALERGVTWVDEQRPGALRAASALLGGALLLNPFAVYLALPLLDRLVRRQGWRALARPGLVIAFAVALAPAGLWYLRVFLVAPTLATANLVALTSPVSHRNFLDLERYLYWLQPQALGSFLWTITRFVLPATTVLVATVGLIATRRDPAWRFLRVWLCAVLVYFFFDYYPIVDVVHHYYYLNLAPAAAAFAAAGFLSLHRWAAAVPTRLRNLVRATAVTLFVLGSMGYTARMADNDWHAEYYPMAERLAQVVPDGSRLQILADSDDPLLSWVLGSVSHRLTVYTPREFEALLNVRDFDFLALTYNPYAPPPWPALHRIRAIGFDEICTDNGLVVYRIPRNGGNAL